MIRRAPCARQAAITLRVPWTLVRSYSSVRAPDARLGRGVKHSLAALDGAVDDPRVGDVALHLFDSKLLQMGIKPPAQAADRKPSLQRAA